MVSTIISLHPWAPGGNDPIWLVHIFQKWVVQPPPSPQALEIIAAAEASGGKVLVHCHEGRSRSVPWNETFFHCFFWTVLISTKLSNFHFSDLLGAFMSFLKFAFSFQFMDMYYLIMLPCCDVCTFNFDLRRMGWFMMIHPPHAHIWGFCLFGILGLCEATVFGWCFGLREIQTAHCSTKRWLSQATLGFWTGDFGKHFWFTRGSSKRKTYPKFLQIHQQMSGKNKSKDEQQQLPDWYVLMFFLSQWKLKLPVFNVTKLKQSRTGEVRPPTAGQVKSWDRVMWCLVLTLYICNAILAIWYVLAFQVHILGNDITTVEGMKEAILWVWDFHVDIKSFLLSPGSGVQNSGCVPAGATYRMLPHVAAGYVGCFHFSYGFKCFHLLLLLYCYGHVFFSFWGAWKIMES